MGRTAHYNNGYIKAQITAGVGRQVLVLFLLLSRVFYDLDRIKPKFLSWKQFRISFCFFFLSDTNPSVISRTTVARFLLFFVREMSFQDLEAGRPLRSQRKLINGNKEGGTQAVASGIFEINTAVSTFQRLVNTLGTPKDTPDLRDKLWVSSWSLGGFLWNHEIRSQSRAFVWGLSLSYVKSA